MKISSSDSAALTVSDSHTFRWLSVRSSYTRLKILTVQKVNLQNKEFLCITHAVEHNYISPRNTVSLQLHVSALYVGHLQDVI